MSLILPLLRPDVWGHSWFYSHLPLLWYSAKGSGVSILGASDTTIEVTLITVAGTIVIGLIGVWTTKITSGARKEAKDNAVSASNSAEIARDFAAAAGAKDALIGALEARLEFLENENKQLVKRVDELEKREEESNEQKRAAALLERDYAREIDDLTAQVAQLRGDRS